MRGSHWMEGQDCILTSVDGGSLTPGEFNGLCRGEAWGESSARLCANLCSITSQLHDCRQLTSILRASVFSSVK